MPETHFGAHSVCLSDLSYQKDREIRVLLGSSTVFAIEVMKEIVDGSLKIKLADLCDTFNCKEADLKSILDLLASSKLLKIEGKNLLVDKEMRKLFSFHIQKFEEDFVPDVAFIESQLMTLPVHLLPGWYCVPKTAEDIFKTIREKYLSSIRVIEMFLKELDLDSMPLAKKIYLEVMGSSDLRVCFQKLSKKLKADDQQMHEALLFLEYNFLCFLTYEKNEENFMQFIAPFHEWREFLLFKKQSVKDLQEQKAPQKLSTPLRWSLFDYSERDLREIENDLKRFIDCGWIDFNDYISASIALVGGVEPLSLKCKCRKWAYERPTYSAKEIPIFHSILFGRLVELGVVEFSKDKNRLIFKVTSYGKAYLER